MWLGGVSIPSLSTNILKHLRRSCDLTIVSTGDLRGDQITRLLRIRDQILDIGCGVVGRNVSSLVPEQTLGLLAGTPAVRWSCLLR
jgi:hypothetical protein